MNIEATDIQIINFITSWVNYLAEEDYEKALSCIWHDPYYQWSPKLIESVVNGYGFPGPHPSGEVFKVTSPETAKGGPRYNVVVREIGVGGCLGHVYYDLPLNGEWSDLTASFRLEAKDKELQVILEEIHVM